MRIEMGALLRQLARRDRRDERIGVDLPVRMVQGDADLDATVLEREHVLHFGRAPSSRYRSAQTSNSSSMCASGSDPSVARGSCVNTTTSQAPSAGRVATIELRADRAPGSAQGRKQILEDRHVVVARRQFGRMAAGYGVGASGLNPRAAGTSVPAGDWRTPPTRPAAGATAGAPICGVGSSTGLGASMRLGDRPAPVQAQPAAVRLDQRSLEHSLPRRLPARSRPRRRMTHGLRSRRSAGRGASRSSGIFGRAIRIAADRWPPGTCRRTVCSRTRAAAPRSSAPLAAVVRTARANSSAVSPASIPTSPGCRRDAIPPNSESTIGSSAWRCSSSTSRRPPGRSRRKIRGSTSSAPGSVARSAPGRRRSRGCR